MTGSDHANARPSGPRRRPTDPIRVTPQDTDRNQTSLLKTASGEQTWKSALEANVIVLSHPEAAVLGRRFRMAPNSTFEIGRASTSEISLPDVMSVSRHHARLRYSGDLVTIEDLDSTNGTYVNDRILMGPAELQSGDRFQVGTVHFKFLRERDPEHAYHQAIYQLVTHDGLTEIFNKRKFDEESEREMARAQRYGRPLSLILFDIDHFKDVNDRFGHLCGDFVLKRIAGMCGELLRPEQMFARIGGEEFAVLCPETGLEGAGHLAERLRECIATAVIEFAGVEVPIRCSFGVAERRSGTTSFDVLFADADAALYRSKNEGRNRTTLSGSSRGSASTSDAGS